MNADSGQEVTRRRLLQLAGTAGLAAATAAACSKQPVANSTPSATPSPIAPSPTTSAMESPPPAPTTTAALAVSPASHVVLCRDAWGAKAPLPGGRPHTLNRMTIHHTAVVLGDNANAPARLRQHQHYHQDTKGWIDIAYHLSVDRHGNIYELRSPTLVGDTATSYDPTGHFLVVCEGNFDEEEVTEEQLNGAALAFAWAAQQFGISPETLLATETKATTRHARARASTHTSPMVTLDSASKAWWPQDLWTSGRYVALRRYRSSPTSKPAVADRFGLGDQPRIASGALLEAAPTRPSGPSP